MAESSALQNVIGGLAKAKRFRFVQWISESKENGSQVTRDEGGSHSKYVVLGRQASPRVPVVIVTGDKDKIMSANKNAYRLHSVVTTSQLIELKDTGHEIPQTHPESIYSALSLISKSRTS